MPSATRSWKRQGTNLPRASGGSTTPLIPWFLISITVREYISVLYNDTKFVVICYSSHGKQIHRGSRELSGMWWLLLQQHSSSHPFLLYLSPCSPRREATGWKWRKPSCMALSYSYFLLETFSFGSCIILLLIYICLFVSPLLTSLSVPGFMFIN